MSKINPDDYNINGLAPLLQSIEGGAFYERMNDDLHKMVRALDWHIENFQGEPSGEMTIKIKITAEPGCGKTVSATYTAKEPPRPRAKARFWSKADGKLTYANPDQFSMPFSNSVITIDGRKAD